MKVHLLGTGAAEGVPALFSSTRVSQIAREKGGREVRMRSSALVDDAVKLDFGPDTLAQIHKYQLDARDWLALAFTHSDDDHFSVAELQYFMVPFSSLEAMPCPIYANEAICRAIAQRYPEWPMETVITRSFETYQFAGYSLTPISAHHKPDEDAQNLILSDNKVEFLYATDTGIWDDRTWEFLEGRKLDAVVMECTEGSVATSYGGHLDLSEFTQMIQRMRKIGALKTDAKVVSTHHSHNGELTYEELVPRLEALGAEAGYDGMVFEVL